MWEGYNGTRQLFQQFSQSEFVRVVRKEGHPKNIKSGLAVRSLASRTGKFEV